MAYLPDKRRVFMIQEMVRHGSVVKTQRSFRRKYDTEKIRLKYLLYTGFLTHGNSVLQSKTITRETLEENRDFKN